MIRRVSTVVIAGLLATLTTTAPALAGGNGHGGGGGSTVQPMGNLHCC
jgi:hypothetical protein